MQDITVKVSDLTTKLQANRAQHLEKYDQASRAYRARAIEELDRIRDALSLGKSVPLAIRLVEPKDHSADYDRVLEALAMHQGDTITLSQLDVEELLMDNWGWRREWDATNTAYHVQ